MRQINCPNINVIITVRSHNFFLKIEVFPCEPKSRSFEHSKTMWKLSHQDLLDKI